MAPRLCPCAIGKSTVDMAEADQKAGTGAVCCYETSLILAYLSILQAKGTRCERKKKYLRGELVNKVPKTLYR